MEMSRGVSTVSLLSTSSMDTCMPCTCPHQTPTYQEEGERTTVVEFACRTENRFFKVLSRHSILRLHSALAGLVSFSMNSKRIMVFLVILLNFLIVGASPTHRVRHSHSRNNLLADRLCESPGEIDQPTHDQCSSMASRVRRDVNTMSLREGQASSLCSYSVCVDEDPARRPVHVHRVFCLQSGCRCTHEGAYRCTQLYNKMEVWYPSTNATQLLDVEYGCVCAAKHGSIVDPFLPNTGDK